MTEVFTKVFWQGVKKTFDEALADTAPVDKAEDSAKPETPAAQGGEPEPLHHGDGQSP